MAEHALTPTQDLLIEVLAARHRLGEHVWTFDSRHGNQLDRLEEAGLVGHKSGVVENTRLAWLTSEGMSFALSAAYSPPTGR